MPLIAWRTLGSIRTVTREVRARAAAGGHERPGVVGRVGAHHDHAGNTSLACGVDGFGHQAGRATSGAGVAAPQPHRRHHRRRDRRGHGGGQHVESAHQQRLRRDLGVSERRTLLEAPEHPPLHRVDIDIRQHVRAGQKRRLHGQLGEYPPVHRGELAHVAVVERAQERPSVDGARIPPPVAGNPPSSSTSIPSIVSAPVTIPATSEPTFRPGFAPTFAATCTCSRTRSSSPTFSASLTAGTNPACDTRFGSSNMACVFAAVCNNRIYEVPFRSRICELQQPAFSQVKGHFCCHDTPPHTIRAVE